MEYKRKRLTNSSNKRSLTRILCDEGVYLAVEDLSFNRLGSARVLDYTRNGLRIFTNFPLKEFSSYRFRPSKKLAGPFECIVCWTIKSRDGFEIGVRLSSEESMAIDNIMTGGSGQSRRLLHRIPLTADGTLNATIELQNGLSIKTSVVDYHCLAISVEVPNPYNLSDKIKCLSIFIGNTAIIRIDDPKIVRTISDREFVFDLKREQSYSGDEHYFTIRKEFQPQVTVKDPLKIESNVFFKVTELSTTGFKAKTSLSNKHLLHGLIFKSATMMLPTIGIIVADFEIASLDSDNRSLIVTCAFHELSKRSSDLLVKFIFLGATDDAKIIETVVNQKRNFLRLQKNYGVSLKIDYAISPRDYREVLDIRFKAYQADGRHTIMKSKYEMSDEYDCRSLILVARLGNTPVGTVRCVPTNENFPQFPFEDSLKLEGEFDRDRYEYYELSKLAVLPIFRKSDVRMKLMQEMTAKVLVNKKGAFCMATPTNAKYYVQTGAYKVSKEIPHPINKNETFALYVYKTEHFLNGRNMSATAWYKFALGPIDFVTNWKNLRTSKFRQFKYIQSKIENLILKFKK